MYKTITLFLLLGLTVGCSTTKKMHIKDEGLTVIDYGADRRGTYLYTTADGVPVIVSEPSPDVAQEITGSLGLSAETFGGLTDPNLKAAYANKVVDLASRSQTLQVLRESLFRLSEMGASTSITAEQRVALYLKVLDTVRLIAATEFVDRAPEDVSSDVLKRFLKDVGTGTIPID